MISNRKRRLAEEIKRELAHILQEEMKDPGLGFASITRVELSNDMGHCKVYFSVLGTPDEQRNSAQAVARAQGFIRSEIGRRIRLRHVPVFTFKIDDSIEQGVRVVHLIDQVKNEAMSDGNSE